jgi:hypothetical protein
MKWNLFRSICYKRANLKNEKKKFYDFQNVCKRHILLSTKGRVILFGIKCCKIFLAEGGLNCKELEEMAG